MKTDALSLAPKIVQSLIQGVFPPVLLAVLFLILPYLLKGESLLPREESIAYDGYQDSLGLRIFPAGP